MDQEKAESAQQKKERAPARKKRAAMGRAIAVFLLLVLAALLIILVLRGSGGDKIADMLSGSQSSFEDNVPFTFETGSGQTFALAGNGFAAASTSSVQLLDSNGKTVFKELVGFTTPAVFGCRDRALFCDIGGTALIVADFDGNVTELETDGEIISAAMEDSGWFTVISEEGGYKGLVQVYDAQCRLIYKWWSGTGYALKAAVSPDCRSMAALTVGQEGGKLHIFSLSSSEEAASIEFPDELLFDISYMWDGSICAISEEHVYFLDSSAALRGSYSMEGSYLCDYDFGSGDFVAICTNVYRTGAGGAIISLNSSGSVLGSVVINRDINALSAQGKQLLVMTPGDIRLYTRDMALSHSEEKLMTAKTAFLRPGGDALLISAYSAEVYKFR